MPDTTSTKEELPKKNEARINEQFLRLQTEENKIDNQANKINN
jgi:hypothetical protein